MSCYRGGEGAQQLAGRVNREDPEAPDDLRPKPGDHLADVLPLGSAHVAGPVPGPGHRLPSFLSSFIGRSQEIDEVAALLGSARLVTLTGAGGLGKTRLAVEVAERLTGGRAFFVDLAPVREPALVGEEIAAAFATGELRGRSLAEVLADALPAGALLVLDNCEHLIETCADQAGRLLKGCRGLQILATSQQRLGVTGEVVWPVPALALPEVANDAVLGCAAVQLFCQRAAAVKRGFVASGDNLAAVIEICRRLDGNPLAIELAAARTDVLSPADLAARLENRFGLLRGGTGAGPARHRTLAAALEWSHDLLSEPERVLLRRLSVFTGGFGLDAAEVVCIGGEVDRHQVLDLLSGLVARSLVVADTGGATARYRLLETVRHYAAEGLSGKEAVEVGRRHADWCAQMVEHGIEADDDAWLAENQIELDNARAALEWCLDRGEAELALRLVAGLMVFWEGCGRFGEARDCLLRVLATATSAPAALRATALHDAGFAEFMLGDFDAARGHLCESLTLWGEVGDPAAAERTQGLLAFVSTFGDDPISVDELESDLAQLRAAGDDARLTEALIACGQARMFRSEFVAAHPHFAEVVALARRDADDVMLATGLVGVGSAALGRGDYGPAEASLREGVRLAAGSAQAHSEAVGRTQLAELARLRGDQDEARARFEECLGRARTVGAPYPLAKSLLGLGRVVLDDGDAKAAQALFDEAAAVARQGGLAHLVAAALDGMGEVAEALGDGATARGRFDQALAAAGQCGDKGVSASCTYHLAARARAEGSQEKAVALHHDALKQRHQIGDCAGVADSLEALAGLAAVRDNSDLAARLFGAAQALRHTGGFPRPPRRSQAYDADVAVLREAMVPHDLERAWSQGAALGYEEAVAYASKGRGGRRRPPKGLDSLTPAERDVAALGAEGLTNPEIGERLFISPRTVQSHLRSVYAKLNVTSRRQLRDAFSGGA